MSDILDDLDSPWPADYALQPKNSSERYDVIHVQEVKRQAAVEIRALREQVAALSEAVQKPLRETVEQLAALAEQNEKIRGALGYCVAHIPEFASVPGISRALSLPDIATTALNRIRAEGMRVAAEICDDYSEKKWRAYKGIDGSAADRACDIVQGESSGAEDCAQAIRARADELTDESMEVKP